MSDDENSSGSRPEPTTVGDQALPELRRARRRQRLANLDIFEALYRVYLTALVAGMAALYLAKGIGGAMVTASELATVRDRGPALLGFLAAIAVATGLRSGSRGGPIGLEPAEVRYVLLAPVDRRRALLPFAIRSIRSALFAGATGGAFAGVLADRRLPNNVWAWAGWGAVAGAAIALLYVAAALLASGIRLKRWIATVAALVIVAGAAADIAKITSWPTTAAGSLALWPLRIRPLDIVIGVVALAIGIGSTTLLGRLALDAAEDRTRLVGNMRIAVTLQDVRSVLVFRRQLVAESPRHRPWFRVPGWFGSSPTWRRSWQSFARTPATRLVRDIILIAGATALVIPIVRGTPALLVAGGVAAYIIGLDLVEPLAQSIDHSDRTDLLPVDTGMFNLRLVIAPAVVAAVVGLILGGSLQFLGTGIGERSALILTAVMLPLAGLAGAATSIVMNIPTASAAATFLPAEINGARIVARSVWPVMVSTAGTLPAYMASRIASRATATPGAVAAAAANGAVGAAAVVFGIASWIRHREAARAWWGNQLELAKQAKPASGESK